MPALRRQPSIKDTIGNMPGTVTALRMFRRMKTPFVTRSAGWSSIRVLHFTAISTKGGRTTSAQMAAAINLSLTRGSI
jgi:hypothetical protein